MAQIAYKIEIRKPAYIMMTMMQMQWNVWGLYSPQKPMGMQISSFLP